MKSLGSLSVNAIRLGDVSKVFHTCNIRSTTDAGQQRGTHSRAASETGILLRFRSSCRRWLSSVSRLSFSSAIDCFLLLPLSLLRISYGLDIAAAAAVLVYRRGNERVGESERGWRAEGVYSWRAVCRVTRWACKYASRQCKIMYGFCWRNRHRSAPATSGFGRHVKSGSCDMPLRIAAGKLRQVQADRQVQAVVLCCVWVGAGAWEAGWLACKLGG